VTRSARETLGQDADGALIERLVLERDGLRATWMNFGASLIGLEVPDRAGARVDVVLGFDTLAEYESARNPYFGGLVGRCANRIAGARFSLDGREHVLAANEGRHHLHGGRRGFDRRAWESELLPEEFRVDFTLTSPAGEEGYPGTLTQRASYRLLPGGVLELQTQASCDAATLWNLTQHSYFNLAGRGSVAEHRLSVRASRFVEVDAELIPSGGLVALAGSALDLRRARRLGECIELLAHTPAGGLDHCFALDPGAGPGLREACRLEEARSGRVLEIATTLPGLQVYTGNRLDDLAGKRGQRYPRHGGVCLETQGFPDAVHHAHFPSVVLRPGELRRETTRWRFSAVPGA